jgi:creatinine amidohydrolase
LSARVASLDDELRRALATPLDVALAGEAFWTTGAGGSEGPARVLTALLGQGGIAARFVPLSTFATGALSPPAKTALVVFSQDLSPNARLALSCRDRFNATLVVGAREAAPLTHVAHGPTDESGMLVRVVGPALATLAAMRIAAAAAAGASSLSSAFACVPDLVAAIATEAPRAPLTPPLALVTAGSHGALVHGLRWKLLEALGVPDPPVWDVLQVAHGPFQQFYHQPMTLLALEHEGEAALFDRLASMLVPERHRLVRLRAQAPTPLSWFEHDALLNQAVLATLAAAPRDLIEWPGKGRDEALYALRDRIG